MSRTNIYAEEMTDRIEIISKEIEGQKFTGLRIYLELPVTVLVCKVCERIEPTTTIKRLLDDHSTPLRSLLAPTAREPNVCISGAEHQFRPRQISGPFMHHPGDDDSSAVTFWGKRDLREVLDKAIAKLDEHYEPRKVTKTVELELPEEDRQMVLLALAVLSLESPGFDHALNEIAKRIDNVEKRVDSVEGDRDRALTYDAFRETRRKPVGHGG